MLVAVSKGMRAVKLCTSKILQFLMPFLPPTNSVKALNATRLTCIMAVKRWLLLLFSVGCFECAAVSGAVNGQGKDEARQLVGPVLYVYSSALRLAFTVGWVSGRASGL